MFHWQRVYHFRPKVVNEIAQRLTLTGNARFGYYSDETLGVHSAYKTYDCHGLEIRGWEVPTVEATEDYAT